MVQLAASIDYGMPFCKSCFNLESDADGLAFVTGEEIKKLEKMICDMNSTSIQRTIAASRSAEELLNLIVTSQKSVIDVQEAELSDVEYELADKIASVDTLSQRSSHEGDVLVVDDEVTLTRRVGRSQVRGKVIGVYVTDKAEVTYDVKPQNGAILYQQSEYSLVKTATGNRAEQHNQDIANLAKLIDKKRYPDDRLCDLQQAMIDKLVIMDNMNKVKMSLSNEKQKLIGIGPSKASEWLEYTKNCVEPGI